MAKVGDPSQVLALSIAAVDEMLVLRRDFCLASTRVEGKEGFLAFREIREGGSLVVPTCDSFIQYSRNSSSKKTAHQVSRDEAYLRVSVDKYKGFCVFWVTG
jgi:hypothetical protein